jgi:hypothetical protein
MSTTSFAHFMSVAMKRYGDIPTAKGDDDGTIFSEFLRESRYPTEQRHVKWEQVKDILEKYKVSTLLLLNVLDVRLIRRSCPSLSRSAIRQL